MNRSEKNSDIDEIAAGWAVRLAEGLSLKDRRDLDAWLERDSRHLGAFVRAQAVWLDLDRVTAMERGASRPVLPRRRFWRNRWIMSAAASLLIAVLVGGGLVYDRFAGRYAAGDREVLRVALDDGSTIVLNTGSVMQVRYGEHERRVLLRRGEASFEVTHDVTRPFVVRARDITVRAVGTQFAVSMTGESVAVTVTDGVVEVQRSGADATEQRQLIVKNDRVVATAAKPIVERKLTTAEVARDLSWRNGLLMFDGETLAAAAAEVNRYSSKPVTIDDPALAAEKFIGVFRIGNSQAFARAAATAFDAEITEGPDGIRLSRQKNPRRE